MLMNRGKVIHFARVVYRKLPISQPVKNRLKELAVQGYRTVFEKPSVVAADSTPAASPSHQPAAAPAPAGYNVTPGARKPVSSIRQLFRNDEIVGGLATNEIELYPNFDDYQGKIDARTEKRLLRQTEEANMLPPQDVGFEVDGHCVICREQKKLSVDFQYAYEKDAAGRLTPNWRESLVCPSCVMNNRVRAAADLLINQLGVYGEDHIFTTEQLTSFYGWLSKHYPNVTGSEYLGEDKTKGEVFNNIRHEDITQLSFADDSLDIILSFDVLEHVPDTASSISEFMRCLKPGGFALISAPFASNDYKTIVRAKVKDDGSIEHLMTPEYHGNPTKPDEGSLCFYHFGWDLVDQLIAGGAKDAGVVSFYSDEKGNLGPEQLFFLAVK